MEERKAELHGLGGWGADLMGLKEGDVDSGTDLTRIGKETGGSQDQSKEGGGGGPPEEHMCSWATEASR